MLSRVISMFAARADLSVDELSDAVLLSDAISAQGPEGFPDGTARIAVSEEDGAFNVRVGPLADGGGAAAARRPADPDARRLAREPRRRGQGRVRRRRASCCCCASAARADSSPRQPPRPRWVAGLLAQLAERAAQDARDVHLRVADALGDLRLGQVLGEAQPQHLALGVVEDVGAGVDRAAVLDQLEARDRRCRSARSSAPPRRARRRPKERRATRSGARRSPRRPRARRPPGCSSSSAISATVGERSSSWLSLAIAPSTSRIRSCRPRGTRRVQTRSRKWRRSSPRIVGPAKAANGTPRSGSKRSSAETRPRLATWIRSSLGSTPPL